MKLLARLNRRAALLSAGLILTGFALTSGSAGAVTACKGTPGITTYYSDAAHTAIVGNYFSGCQGGCNGSGQITKWYRFDHYICTD